MNEFPKSVVKLLEHSMFLASPLQVLGPWTVQYSAWFKNQTKQHQGIFIRHCGLRLFIHLFSDIHVRKHTQRSTVLTISNPELMVPSHTSGIPLFVVLKHCHLHLDNSRTTLWTQRYPPTQRVLLKCKRSNQQRSYSDWQAGSKETFYHWASKGDMRLCPTWRQLKPLLTSQ